MRAGDWIGRLVVFTWTRASEGVEPEDVGLVTEVTAEILRDPLTHESRSIPRLRVWWLDEGRWSAHPAYQLKLVEE